MLDVATGHSDRSLASTGGVREQTREVVTSGLCRGELEGVVAGAGRVIAAMSALQTRCATEIEALDDGGVNSKTVLREAERLSTP